MLLTFALSSFQSAFGTDPGGKTFAVKTIGGVPVFTIDGTPTRSRIFFGRPGTQPVLTSTEYARYEFEFVAEENGLKQGTIHFRFGVNPGEIDLDNITLIDKETGTKLAGPYDFENDDDFTKHWETWHEVVDNQRIATVNTADGVGVNGSRGLQIKIVKSLPDRFTDFHLFHERCLDLVQGKTYVLSFDARSSNSRSLHIAFYRPAEPAYALLGRCGKDVLDHQVRLAADAGVNFVSFISNERIWPDANGKLDFTGLDQICDVILRANPNALLIPRLELNPNPAWLKANPHEREIWRNAGKDHDRQGWDWPSLCSEKYRQTANQTLAAIIRHLEEKYGDSIAGYHPCGQNTDEWFTPNTWTEGDAGFSEHDRRAFREWLKAKYHEVEKLRNAWNDSNVSFETADVPSSEERLASRNAPYLESEKLVDFNDFWQTRTTNVIRELAHTVKKETNGRKLSFFFYGYSYEFSTVVKGPAASSHYALRELLNCPDVDVICSPISYSDRILGGGCSCMLNAESVTASGKIYLYEDDCRTYLAHAVGERLASVATVEDSVNIVLRNSSETAERNFGTWLMDLGGVGWYDSPEIWDAVKKLGAMDQYFLDCPTPYRPEIALFLSERSMLRVSSGTYTGDSIASVRTEFNRVGAPYAQYDLSDLLSGAAPCHKLTVVLNADALDENERAKLEIIERSGKTKVVRCSLDKLTTRQIRELAKEANVWLYTDRPCNVWANGPFVTLHAPEDGEYRFRAPEGTKTITDFITGKTLANGADYVFKMKTGETKILQLSR